MSNGTNTPVSADDIFDAANTMKERFVALIKAIGDEIEEIFGNAAAAGHEPTAAEKATIESRRADQRRLRNSLNELAFATLEKLDNSAELETLRTRLTAVNAELKDDLQRLKSIARYAEIAAKAADGLTQLAIKAAATLAK